MDIKNRSEKIKPADNNRNTGKKEKPSHFKVSGGIQVTVAAANT